MILDNIFARARSNSSNSNNNKTTTVPINRILITQSAVIKLLNVSKLPSIIYHVEFHGTCKIKSTTTTAPNKLRIFKLAIRLGRQTCTNQKKVSEFTRIQFVCCMWDMNYTICYFSHTARFIHLFIYLVKFIFWFFSLFIHFFLALSRVHVWRRNW